MCADTVTRWHADKMTLIRLNQKYTAPLVQLKP